MDQAALMTFDQRDPRRIGWIDGLPDAKLADDLGPGSAEPAEAVAPPQTFWDRRIAAEISRARGSAIESEALRILTSD